MAKLDRHPLSMQYGDISGQQWTDFVDNVREVGAAGRAITLHDGKVLDGWQLYRACLEAGVKPMFTTLPKGQDPEVFVETANDRRRHMDADQVMARALSRRKRVAAAREAGKSFRAIAEDEDVSETQVRRDVAAGAPPVSPEVPKTLGISKSDDDKQAETGRTTGKDGKTYPATKPPVKVLCARCQRVGAVADCAGCKEVQKSKPLPLPPGSNGKPPPARGEPHFDNKLFREYLGKASAEANKLAREYGYIRPDGSTRDTPELKGIRDKLEQIVRDMDAWRTKLQELARTSA